MKNKPVLYYSCINGTAFDNFCSDAAIGARDSGIETSRFEDISEISYDPYNIVVAPVEDTQSYLGRSIPVIDHCWAQEFLKRDSKVFRSIEDIEKYPCFIKPSENIKAFTGFISDSREFSLQCSHNYTGRVLRQEIIDIESEYRVYMSSDRGMLGVYYYLGDPFIRPDREFVEMVAAESRRHLTEKSYTLDFGVDINNNTFLIEVNDGWSIGNYGLPPVKYYHFVKNRFLQLTGALK